MTDDLKNNSSDSSSKREPRQEGSAPWFSPSWALLAAVLLIIGMFLFSLSRPATVDYVFVWKQAEQGNIESVEFNSDIVEGEWK